MKKTVLFVLFMFVAPLAHPQFLTGNRLLDRLNGSNSTSRINAYGYITGVADATNADGEHCVPNGVTVGQMADVVKKVLENVPELRHGPADSFVKFALKTAWPCNTAPKTSL